MTLTPKMTAVAVIAKIYFSSDVGEFEIEKQWQNASGEKDVSMS